MASRFAQAFVQIFLVGEKPLQRVYRALHSVGEVAGSATHLLQVAVLLQEVFQASIALWIDQMEQGELGFQTLA